VLLDHLGARIGELRTAERYRERGLGEGTVPDLIDGQRHLVPVNADRVRQKEDLDQPLWGCGSATRIVHALLASEHLFGYRSCRPHEK
jgi:hypothetical protein